MEVKTISEGCIKPSSYTPSHLKTYKISLLDQFMPPVYFSTAFFYLNTSNINNTETSVMLKHSLSKTLSHFYPLAGKIKDSVSIECDDEGAYYTQATANISMPEFLRQPDHAALKKLVPDASLFNQNPIGAFILMIQETVFACGGLAIGFSVSHLANDGYGFGSFIKAWASAASSPTKQIPSPYLIDMFPLYEPFPKEALFPALWAPFAKKRKVAVRRFVFDASAIDKLKSEAASRVENPSRVEVVSAIISKSVKAALNAKSIAICHSANMRRKATPPIPDCSMGNFVWILQAICTEDESQVSEFVCKLRGAKRKLEREFMKNVEGGFSKLFEEVKEMGLALSSDDGMEMIGFSSLCNFDGYDGSDFGWGKPVWMSHCTAFDSEEIMFHNMGTLNDTRTGINGVEAWMYLYPEVASAMEKDVHLLQYASIDPPPLTMLHHHYS